MNNNIFVFELHDFNKIITFNETIRTINTTSITIPINHYFEFDGDISFDIKLNGIKIYDSIKELFLLTNPMIFKKLDYKIHIDNTYYVNILNFILISDLECISKNENDHRCLSEECCYSGMIKEILFIIDPLSNKKRIDGFPECIGKVAINDLTMYELSIINNKKIVYTFYQDDIDSYFVKMQKILDDDYISMINYASGIDKLNDEEFDLLFVLCDLFTKHQSNICLHTHNDGTYEYYLHDNKYNQHYILSYFLKIHIDANGNHVLKFNSSNAKNIIKYLNL